MPPAFLNNNIYVVTSPLSGKGEARAAYKHLVLPLLEELGVLHTHIELTSSDTLGAWAETTRLSAISTFFLLGGDGITHDLINGLARNEANLTDSVIELILMPCGSGNALATSLGIQSLAAGIDTARGGGPAHLPIMKVTGLECDERGIFGVVVVSWALHAAIVGDSDSKDLRERYGNERFKVGVFRTWYRSGLTRWQKAAVANLHSPYPYQGTIRLCDAIKHPFARGEKMSMRTLYGPHAYFIATRTSHLEPGYAIAPLTNPTRPETEPTVDIVHIQHTDNADYLSETLMEAYQGDGRHLHREHITYWRAKNVRLCLDEASETRRRICVDGVIMVAKAGQEIGVTMVQTAGPRNLQIKVYQSEFI